jgi:hypothetical protein
MLVRSRNHTVKEHEVLRPLMYVYGQISPELLIMPDRQRRIPCQGSILPSGMTKLTEVRVCKVDLTEHGVPCSIWSPDRVGAEEQGCQARRTRFEVAIYCCKLVPVFHAGSCRPCWTTQPAYGEPDSESPERLEMETS